MAANRYLIIYAREWVLGASSEWSEIRLDLSYTQNSSGRKHKDAVHHEINIVLHDKLWNIHWHSLPDQLSTQIYG